MTTRRVSSWQLSGAEVTRCSHLRGGAEIHESSNARENILTVILNKPHSEEGREKPLVAADNPLAPGKRLPSDNLLL